MVKQQPKPQKAFGAANSSSDWVSAWTIHGTAYSVRNAVGKAWNKDNPANGWKAAKLDGVRLVKVEIRVIR